MNNEEPVRWSIVATNRGETIIVRDHCEVFAEAVAVLSYYLSSGAYKVVIIDQTTQTPLVMVHNS